MAIGDLSEQTLGGGHELLERPEAPPTSSRESPAAEHDAIQAKPAHHARKTKAAWKQSEPPSAGDRARAGSFRGIHRAERTPQYLIKEPKRVTNHRIDPAGKPMQRAEVRSDLGGRSAWGLTDGEDRVAAQAAGRGRAAPHSASACYRDERRLTKLGVG